MFTIRLIAGSAVLLALAAAPPLAAAEKEADSAMRVAIDRHTGEIRPATPAEIAHLQELERRASGRFKGGGDAVDGVQSGNGLRRYPGGYVGMEVPASLHSVLTATVNEDGSVSVRHADPAEVNHDH